MRRHWRGYIERDMRLRLAFLLISLLQVPACDLTGGSENLQNRIEMQLRRYFPNAHALASPEEGTIFAATCTQGLGKPLIEQIVMGLEREHGIQQLHLARLFPVKLSPYRFFVLHFGDYYARLDAETKQYWIVPSDNPDRTQYRQLCNSKQ